MRSVVLIGNFDGVHLGHAKLLERATGIAHATPGDRPRVVVLTFDPHPSVVLGSGKPDGPGRLTGFEQRTTLLGRLGADDVVRMVPSEQMLSLSPEAFWDEYVLPRNPLAVVEGEDFRFGRHRLGGIETLRALGEGSGVRVEVVPDLEVTLGDHTIVRASSTVARWLLGQGRVADVSRVLGRAYELVGDVQVGDRRGRLIDFPTANLATDQLPPGDGVYACEAELEDGRVFPAAVNVGERPTFNTLRRTVEAHLIDAPRDGDVIDGLVEYGWALRLRFVSRVRDQVKFGSVAALVEQIHRDVARVRVRLGSTEVIA